MAKDIGNEEIAREVLPSGLSDLWKTEDYWANWTGLFLIALGLMIFLPRPPEDLEKKLTESNRQLASESMPIRTLAWFEASDTKGKLKATNEDYAKTIKRWTHRPHSWDDNPLNAFWLGRKEAEDRKAIADQNYLNFREREEELKFNAENAEVLARSSKFKNSTLNHEAEEAIANYRSAHRKSSVAKKKTRVIPFNQIGYLIILGLVMGLLFTVGICFMDGSGIPFLKGFLLIYGLAVLAYVFAGQEEVKAAGIGYAAWAILLGLLVSNTLGTPQWVRPAIKVEFFIKTGLVLLGAEILFGKILSIGLPGIFVAWVVTPIVLLTTYWFGQKILKLESKTLNIVICADMSVCGVSAAIATAAACRAKKEELTLAVGLSLGFTSVMMVVMPNIILSSGMDHVLGGAWMGGTIDATGAVAAAGAFLSERALHVAATVKMIQNILIGVIAFGVAIYWTTRVECGRERAAPGAKEIWRRFPKFVIGFAFSSLLFSLIYQLMGQDVGETMIAQGVVKGWTKIWRGWFFCLAFVSIGLATNFRQLGPYFKGGKPLVLYVCGQTLNLILTLGMAYVMFYLVFPEITTAI